MGTTGVTTDQFLERTSQPLPCARSYQVEAFEKSVENNTIVFLETGSGKTLIAIMLLRSYAHLLRKPSPYVAVFLVPTVVLVAQQAGVVTIHTDLKVGQYWGDMGVDFWDDAIWKEELSKYEVLVMTPAILLGALRHSFIRLEMIKVLIFDECHNARGKHPYACIMKEFYHQQLHSERPRIFGMTASPVKAKGSNEASAYWKQIKELENLMNSKVYTCESESVLTNYIPFSAVKVKYYDQIDSPFSGVVKSELRRVLKKHLTSVGALDAENCLKDSTCKKLTKLTSMFNFCVTELGLWLTLKAAESFCSEHTLVFFWGKIDACFATAVKGFLVDVQSLLKTYFPSGSEWSIGDDIKAKPDAQFVSNKVLCLLDLLLEYRNLSDLRCIIFVERVVTAIVLKALLEEHLPKFSEWKAEYIAGNNYALQPQSRSQQNKIVDEFRRGRVNIIVATSVLEEGLDVQSCTLVTRFDLSTNVCSFIQSRGRARMRESDFVLMVKGGDARAVSQVKTFLSCTEVMRGESLRHSSLPCEPVEPDTFDNQYYRVESTGAVVTLNSSISLVYFYCSRLPSDMYFKSLPRFYMDNDSRTCKIQFPSSCPLPSVTLEGDSNLIKQVLCLEACKKLHQIGALSDKLVPDIVHEEALVGELENEPYFDEQNIYLPPELVSDCPVVDSISNYNWYLIKLKRHFEYNVPLQNIILLINAKHDHHFESLHLDFEVDRGSLAAEVIYMGTLRFTAEQVFLCRRFQLAVLKVLQDHSYDKLKEVMRKLQINQYYPHLDYLILPSCGPHEESPSIDWECLNSALFVPNGITNSYKSCSNSKDCCRLVYTQSGSICSCMLKNCLAYTPHNGRIYCISGSLDNLNGYSNLRLNANELISYKNYYRRRYGIDLQFTNESLLRAKPIFKLQKLLSQCTHKKKKSFEDTFCELPPELCSVLMSRVSLSTYYTFSFVPLIMHRVESLLVCANLQRIYSDFCMNNFNIPTAKVLEALTTKKCQESFHLESLETLGDSFLKYVISQQLFKTHQNHHEGLLSLNREKLISNSALGKLGCERKIPDFIRNEPFEPKKWAIPGDPSTSSVLKEEFVSTERTMYIRGTQKLKFKRVADVVEALIGAFLSSAGEFAAISFMNFLGLEVDLSSIPYNRQFYVQPSLHVNISKLEALLGYEFHEPSLLVEALTHGSYMLPQLPRCYQRLEFLGDSVLDYLITLHVYYNHPGISPGLLTDLRSVNVNNYSYAYSAVRAGLHKSILHASHDLHKHITTAVQMLDKSAPKTTFEWDSEIHFPKVLGDVIESLAGAIYIDSGYNKDVVFDSIRPLLEPLVTLETLKPHPLQELNSICQKYQYRLRKPNFYWENGATCCTLEVDAKGVPYSHTGTASDKKMAQMITSKAILKSLKESIQNAA